MSVSKISEKLYMEFYRILGVSLKCSILVKNPLAYTGDLGSTPRSGKSPGVESGNPLQYSCLENPVDRGAWGATVHGVTKSWTRQKQLSTDTFQKYFTTLLKALGH